MVKAHNNINIVISAVAKTWKIDKELILHDKRHVPSEARGAVCYIVKTYFPQDVSVLAVIMDKCTSAIYKASNVAAFKNAADEYFSEKVHRALKRLHLIGEDNKGTTSIISATRQLFGFDYTEAEEKRRKDAMIESIKFMKRYCALGVQPLKDGMVFAM